MLMKILGGLRIPFLGLVFVTVLIRDIIRPRGQDSGLTTAKITTFESGPCVVSQLRLRLSLTNVILYEAKLAKHATFIEPGADSLLNSTLKNHGRKRVDIDIGD